jgi:hypothetical protein
MDWNVKELWDGASSSGPSAVSQAGQGAQTVLDNAAVLGGGKDRLVEFQL